MKLYKEMLKDIFQIMCAIVGIFIIVISINSAVALLVSYVCKSNTPEAPKTPEAPTSRLTVIEDRVYNGRTILILKDNKTNKEYIYTPTGTLTEVPIEMKETK
jgi:hypothetical protein